MKPYFFSHEGGVFVVSDVNASGPIRTEANNMSNNYVVTQDQEQFYVVNLENGGRMLVPVRSLTPPPSYKSLFGSTEIVQIDRN